MKYTTIGIDIGGHETTATFPRQPNGNDSRFEMRRLVAENMDQVILTQIVLTNEQMRKLSGKLRPSYSDISQLGEMRIGNKISTYISDGEKFCYFKVPPKDFDTAYGNTDAAKEYGITHGQIMACYIFALTKCLFKNNIELKSARPEDVVLLIGCPTTKDWIDPAAQNCYAELVKMATNVRDVRIVPESRAAMFSSAANEENKISAIKGAIVFDFGSSTADCTYMLLGRKIIEFSWTLGASEIERQMTLEAYRMAVESQGMFDFEMTSFADIEGQLCIAKEGYYDDLYGANGHPMVCSFQVSENGQYVETIIRINDELMKKVTGEKTIQVLCDSKTSKSGTWVSLCEAFFVEAKKKIQGSFYPVTDKNGNVNQQKCEIDTIVLTGGASKMGFVYDLCKRVFDGVTIRIEDNPVHTVSNGLGWVAISDDNVELCKAEAKRYIDSVPECSLNALRNSLEDNVFNKIKSIAEKCTQDWANASGDTLTLRDLGESIENTMASDQTKAEINKVCSDTISEWKDRLSTVMDDAVNQQVSRLYSESVAKGLIIPNDIWKNLQASNIDLNSINVSGILKGIDVTSIAREIGQWAIIGAAVGIGGTVGTLGAAVGFVVGLVAASFLKDSSMDRPRKKDMRLQTVVTVRSKINEQKDKVLKSLRKDISKFDDGYSKQINDSLTVAFEIVTLKRFGK